MAHSGVSIAPGLPVLLRYPHYPNILVEIYRPRSHDCATKDSISKSFFWMKMRTWNRYISTFLVNGPDVTKMIEVGTVLKAKIQYPIAKNRDFINACKGAALAAGRLARPTRQCHHTSLHFHEKMINRSTSGIARLFSLSFYIYI